MDGAILKSLEKHPSQKNELHFLFHLPGNRERLLRLRSFQMCTDISEARQTFYLPVLPDYLYKRLLAHNVLQLKFNIFSGQILLVKRVCIVTAGECGLDPDYHSVMTESAQCRYYDLEETVFKMKDLFKQ